MPAVQERQTRAAREESFSAPSKSAVTAMSATIVQNIGIFVNAVGNLEKNPTCRGVQQADAEGGRSHQNDTQQNTPDCPNREGFHS